MSSKVTKTGHTLQRLLIQHVSHFKYLKGTGLLERFSSQIKGIIQQLEQDKRKIGFYGALVAALREPLLIAVVSIVILIQTNLLGSPLGPILISLLFFYRALSSLMTMQASWNTFLSVSGSTENMTSFLHELHQMKEPKGKIPFQGFTRELVLRDVTVSFDQKDVLKDISLTIKKNETIAFVGESGSGKSTLVNVIAGLIAPDGGEFLIDGLSYRELKLQDYQKHIGFITQEPVIFSDTIFDNISFWEQPNEENSSRFREATQKASISDFIKKLQDGGDIKMMIMRNQQQRIVRLIID